MQFTRIFLYWEEGSRPGRMKLNLVENRKVVEYNNLDEALESFKKCVNHAIQISYHQSMFHSGYLFEGDVSDLPNPFYNRKRFEIKNEEVVDAYFKTALRSERPAYWAQLDTSEQQLIGALDKLSPDIADSVARKLINSRLPV